MNRKQNITLCLITCLSVLFTPYIADAKQKPLTDAAIKKLLIKDSIRAYPGSCPCPYSRDRAGRRCGGRSAWSRPGGYSPLCYESDVTGEMVKEQKEKKLAQ